jgi:hypothetical protein
VTDLTAALQRAAAQLESGASDSKLAQQLESFAAALGDERGNAMTTKRTSSLAMILQAIAARIR